MNTILNSFLALVLAFPLWGGVAEPQLVDTEIAEAFVPLGFDTNDNSQFMVEGFLSNTCYKLAPRDVNFDPDSKVIEVTAHAYKFPGLCLQMIIPFSFVVDLGVLEAGNYRVQDGASKGFLDTLTVTTARSEKIDDFLYAPVEDVTVDTEQKILTLTGKFSMDCLRISDVELQYNKKNVLLVRPIMERYKTSCRDKQVNFQEVRKIPHPYNSRTLVHVRTLNGGSINKLYDMR